MEEKNFFSMEEAFKEEKKLLIQLFRCKIDVTQVKIDRHLTSGTKFWYENK